MNAPLDNSCRLLFFRSSFSVICESDTREQRMYVWWRRSTTEGQDWNLYDKDGLHSYLNYELHAQSEFQETSEMHQRQLAFNVLQTAEGREREMFEFLTSSTVGGTSVKFLPTQATVSLVLSQLHTLGHLPASTCKLCANISRKAAAEKKCICASKMC